VVGVLRVGVKTAKVPVLTSNMESTYRARWMLFVDGENLTLEAQKVSQRLPKLKLTEGPYYSTDTFVWMPERLATENLLTPESFDPSIPIQTIPSREPNVPLQAHAIRAHYYTTVTGSTEKSDSIKNSLWNIGFTPYVFWKKKDAKSKGVDIALTTDLLSNAYRDNYDVAVLCAGDGDYVPLVEEVKRLGKVVYLLFFDGNPLNDKLMYASDTFHSGFGQIFVEAWHHYKPG
jgi:uncharacterized LabA/DUF88 family protein